MDKERRKILQNFANKNPKLFFALNKWVQVKNKDFGVWTALNVLYDASGGAEQKLKSMITQLTSENKVRGRSQVYADKNPEGMDIVNDTGTPRVVGYSEDFEASPKGQPQRNPAQRTAPLIPAAAQPGTAHGHACRSTQPRLRQPIPLTIHVPNRNLCPLTALSSCISRALVYA